MPTPPDPLGLFTPAPTVTANTLDVNGVGNANLSAYGALTPGVLAANNNFIPQFAGQQQTLTRDQLFGNFDAQAFDSAHPGFIAEFRAQQAAGELKGWTPEQYAKAYVGNEAFASYQNRYRTGGVLDDYAAATTALGNQQAAANTQQRTADIADVEALGGRANAAFQNANPQLRAAMDALNARAVAGNPARTVAAPTLGAAPTAQATNAQQTQAGLATAALTTATAPTLGAARQAEQTLATAPTLGAANGASLTTAYGSPLMRQLEGDASRGLNAQTGLQHQLAAQAQTNLASSGYLTAEGRRTAAQAARTAAADRGVALGNGAIFDEALNSENLRQQRMAVAQQQALAIDANGQQQTQANRGYAANVAGMGNALSSFNAGQGNTRDQFNTAQRNTFDLTRYGTETNINQLNATQGNALAQFNTGQANSFDLTRYGTEAEQNRFNAGAANTLSQFNASSANEQNRFNAGQGNALSQFNATSANAASQFNAGQQGSFDLTRYGTEASINQANAEMGMQRDQQNFDNQASVAGMYAQQARDPFALLTGRSAAPAAGMGAVAGAQGNTGQLYQNYGANPFDPGMTSIQNANMNAQNAANATNANNRTASQGSKVAAIGAVAGVALMIF